MRYTAPRHYPPAVGADVGKGEKAVVTGRKIGLQASGGNESAKDFLGAGVILGW